MHLACPACGSTNRVPDERLSDQPVCGKCKAPLMAAEPAALDDGSLPGFLARTGLPVVVDFWAQWCAPCKMIAPHFANAARQMPQVRFVKVDTDACPEASARHGIRSIPTMILFDQGREVKRMSGAMSATDLSAWIRRHAPASVA